jgi:hypothetical protein
MFNEVQLSKGVRVMASPTRVAGIDAIDPKKIDIGIWDLMSDFKKRDAKEILDTLGSRGYNRGVADKRLDTLMAKSWFNRTGRRSNLTYTLIRDVKRPELPVQDDPVVVEEPKVNFGITEADDALASVWKVMTDYKGRTTVDVIKVLKNIASIEDDEVEQMLRIMLTNGFVTTIPDSKSGENIYTLKKGSTMPSPNQQKQIGKPRAPMSALQGMDPSGVLDLTQGMMVCLWKVVSDRKGRTQNQILDILGAYGINREVAKDSFVRAKVNLKWFDFHGSGILDSVYTMKKHIKMPEVIPTDPEVLKTKLSPDGIRVTRPVSAPVTLTATAPSGKNGRHHYYQESGQLRGDTQSPNGALHQELAPTNGNEPAAEEVVVTEAVVVAAGHPPVVPGDTLDIAIWKIMSDRQQYTSGEVVLLMQDFPFNPSSIKARISVLARMGEKTWFDRELNKNNKTREYVYTLRAEVPMPVAVDASATDFAKWNEKVDADKAAADERAAATERARQAVSDEIATIKAAQKKAAPAEPVQQTIDLEQKDEPVANQKTDSAPKAQPVALLHIPVFIKGVEYSMADAKELAAELFDNGFGHPEASTTNVRQSKFLKVAFSIGDTQFSADEANQLAVGLKNAGIYQEPVDTAA